MTATCKYDNLRARIRGPVFPIVVPFDRNEDVDYESLTGYVKFLVDNGAKNLLLTVGTSRYNLLTDMEMLKVNETVANAACGNALVIAAGPGPVRGSIRQNIEFARHASSSGADGILLLYPERWYGDEPVVDFFRKVAESTDIGIMIHAVPMRDGYGGVKALKYLDADLIGKIVDEPNIIGIKEENGDRAVFEEVLDRFNKTLPIIGAGGAMRRFIGDKRLGSYTYLVGIGSFKPEITLEFYDSVMAGDIDKAEKIAEKYEDPYFQFAVKLGWHRALKETLSQLDIMPPFERAPFNRVSEDHRETLNKVLAGCGWL
ncbi:MAG TPA: dihydrodipicolinate synthase family protein [Phycisphaerales bacterium]|nr:dihydrodipicolinate synthase family protein [Phycisphaerales bacterium]